MGENSKIEWTDHTFNPWMGCTKVSDGCKHCYAEREMDGHWHKVQWGPQGTRVRTSAQMWRQPLKWNKTLWVECQCGWRGVFNEHGRCPACEHPMVATMKVVRQRVFCASLADVFEQREELDLWRADLWKLIEQTPNLDWLILTKRPQNVLDMVPSSWLEQWPANVWIGTSVENQRAADERIPELLKVPAPVRFLSCEPLLAPVDLGFDIWWDEDYYEGEVSKPRDGIAQQIGRLIHWVIAGGESGPKARLMPLQAVRSIVSQCQAHNVRFLFKQWGEWAPIIQLDWVTDETRFSHQPVEINGELYAYVTKARAGRMLDGREWSETPSLPSPKCSEECGEFGGGDAR